jgi:tetratricopeptide (TPR) repeat protein
MRGAHTREACERRQAYRRPLTRGASVARLDPSDTPLRHVGEQGRIFDHLRVAATRAEVPQDQHRLGWVAIYMTSCFYNMGRPDKAIETGQRALAMAESLGEVALQVHAAYYLELAYHLLGDLHQAVEALGRNVTSLEGELVQERFGLPYLPSVFSRTWLVWYLAELGSFAEAIARGREAVRISEAIDQPWDLLAAYRGISLPYLSKREIQTAIPLLERCLGLCQVWEISGWFAVIAAQFGLCVCAVRANEQSAATAGAGCRAVTLHACSAS